MSDNSRYSISTRSVHAGEDRLRDDRDLLTPLRLSATFPFKNTAELTSFFEGTGGHTSEYSRYGNETVRVAERKIAALEESEDCVLFSSGMAATSTALGAFLKPGDKIALVSDCYRGTKKYLYTVMQRQGIEILPVTFTTEAITDLLNNNEKVKVVFTEAPTNPYLRVPDLEKIAEAARSAKSRLIVDATVASPANLHALKYGAHLVLHSATKYLGGHNDLLAGAVCGSEGIISAIREIRGSLGNLPDAHTSYLLSRGIKTFALRMRQINTSAEKIAEFLQNHDAVQAVYHPSCKDNETAAAAEKYLTGGSGLVSFLVKGDLDTASKVIDSLELFRLGASLGGVESLVQQPAIMSYYDMTTEERKQAGIDDNLIRLSVGIEDTEDLINDLGRSLNSLLN